MADNVKVTVRKVNEVFIKIETDDSTLMEISDYFTFFVPGYQFMPTYKNKFWDGKIRLVTVLTASTYVGLSRYIERFCEKRKYDFEYTYDNSDVSFSVQEAMDFFKTLDLKRKGKSITPFDHQIKAFVHCVRKKRCLLLSPTGSGKSLIAYLLYRYYNSKTLIIVPTIGLVKQLKSDFQDYGYKGKIHMISSGADKNIADSNIVITTWQSIYKMHKKWFQNFEVVIGDEAHGFKAKSLTNIMTKIDDAEIRIGMTGTLDDSETHKFVLEGLFGPVKQFTTTKELIDSEVLSPFTIKAITLIYTEDERKLVSKMSYQQEIEWLRNHPKRNKFLSNLALSLKGNTLLLFRFIEHGEKLYKVISETSERSVYYIDGGVSGDMREEIRGKIELEEDITLIASLGTTSTGTDMPSVQNLIPASPLKAKIKNLQSIGRILRKRKDKEAILFDISDDLAWKTRSNFSLLHYKERSKVYKTEKFIHKEYKVNL